MIPQKKKEGLLLIRVTRNILSGIEWERWLPLLRQQTISFIEISIEAGKLLGGKHEACFVLGVAGIEPMPS